MKDTFSFSSDNGKISRKDLDETSKISEEYFGMEKDPHQIPATSENREWIYKNVPEYLNVIREGENIIGYSFLLPCTKTLMEDFITKKIDEAALFESIKKIKFEGIPEALYLCASIMREGFRGKGLATSAFVKAINKITHNGKEKPVLFSWKYSEEGGRLVKRVADATRSELRTRE